MKVTLYRGMNEDEYKIRRSEDSTGSLFNISWWSEDLLTAQLYATHAILKCTINLDANQEVSFQSGARGNLDSYQGFGVNPLNSYSISKDYLKENVIDSKFLFKDELIPKFIKIEDGIKELGEEITVIKHLFDEKRGVKLSIGYEMIDKTQLEYILKEYEVVKVKDDYVQVYKFV